MDGADAIQLRIAFIPHFSRAALANLPMVLQVHEAMEDANQQVHGQSGRVN
jgi:hypothetical protein